MLSHIGPIVIIVMLLIACGLVRTFVRNASRAVVAVLADPDDPDIGVQTQWLLDSRSLTGGLPSGFARVASAPRRSEDDASVITPEISRGNSRHDAASVRDGRVAKRTATVGKSQAPLVRRAPLDPRPPLGVRAIHPPLPALVTRAAIAPLSPYNTTASRSDSWR